MKKGLFLLPLLLLSSCGNPEKFVLNESTFFLVMTNIQYYPEEYLEKDIIFDCFTYELTSVSGEKYMCGVRKCSSGYGCKCGKDTVIGFLFKNKEGLPAPINQYEDTNDKAWIHVTGQIESVDKTDITMLAADGTEESVQFLSFDISSFNVIEDYSNLHYYVDK